MLAKECPAGEAAEYYRLAVMLDPVSEEGYLGLIRCAKGSAAERKKAPSLLREALSAAEYDRFCPGQDRRILCRSEVNKTETVFCENRLRFCMGVK